MFAVKRVILFLFCTSGPHNHDLHDYYLLYQLPPPHMPVIIVNIED